MNQWTRKRILDAFTELVSEEGYDNVTAEMIMKRADVGKTTFYRYFRNKAAVMYAHYQELYDEAIADENCTTLTDLFTLLLKTTRERPEELHMFDTIGYDSYREFIYTYTYNRGRQIMETAWGRPLSSKEDFVVAFFCGGGARILEEWACGRYGDLSNEEAGKAIGSLVQPRYSVQLDDKTKTKKGTKKGNRTE